MEDAHEVCSICHEKPNASTTTFVCNHIFCQTCLTTWYFLCVEQRKNPCCPMCRKYDHIWGK